MFDIDNFAGIQLSKIASESLIVRYSLFTVESNRVRGGRRKLIEVAQPVIGEEEIAAVVAALARGELSAAFSPSVREFEEAFAAYCGCTFGIAVSSGTTALHLAVAAAPIAPGDEVLVSASTSIATALAAYHNQAIAIPVDSEDATRNMNLDLIESLITERTRAILPVHLYGHPVDMDRLMEIAKKHDLTVIEDCAQAPGAMCRGKRVGSFGDMACFSFYASKHITTGEGGMVVTNDAALAERLRSLRNLAYSEPRFLHHEAGYNFRMTGFQAAMGLAQLKKLPDIINEKRRIARTYTEVLCQVPGLRLPAEPDWSHSVYWTYGIVVQPEFGMSRDDLLIKLKDQGIDTRTFFCPLNIQPCLKTQEGFRETACPVAERHWETGFYLPSTHTLETDTVAWIAETVAQAPKSSAGAKQ
jgi:perosamine synthetase